MKTDLFQSCGHCWVFHICWHIDSSTFTASSFKIWNSSTGIPSLPLAFFVVMLPKAHLTSHSRMSGSRWLITPSWLSGSWSSFLYWGLDTTERTSLSLFTFMHWRRKWQPTPVFLPGESQGRGSLVGSHRVGHDWSDLAAAAAGLLWCLRGKESACQCRRHEFDPWSQKIP